MRVIKQPYISKEALENSSLIYAAIIEDSKYTDVFIITLPANNTNILDIYELNDINSSVNKEIYKEFVSNTYVIGFAIGKEKAMELSSSIVTQMYNETKSFDIKEYLKNQF